MRTGLCVAALAAALVCSVSSAFGRELHVSVGGDDNADGSIGHPLKTISAAAQRAQPGDSVTVHEGLYREWVRPERGGESDARRIVYQAAPGETVEIRGSEVIKGWEHLQGDVWKVVLPNDMFGDYNPYQDRIHGDWFNPRGRTHHTGAVYLNGDWLMEAADVEAVLSPDANEPLWFGYVGGRATTLWARFKGADPNQESVEINVRRAVFYPTKPGVNYITVRGFIMRHAATQWAPPTAEQIGLIGTHWSRGWLIENNVISHSKCVGLSLGKYGDAYDNTSQDTAEGYVLTIQRALEKGWSKENIGGHVVRHNTISHCEQAGIVGSLGAVFSTITDNTIHDIHVKGLFTGAEMAGIKIHAAIDTTIADNRIYRTVRGIWLDWMNQGARVIGNLLYENASEDLFVEVNHGPFVVDNNVFLSATSLLDVSEGGAYLHNLFAGGLAPHPEPNRETPYHQPHSTRLAGLRRIEGGDNRFLNNLFLGGTGLAPYDHAAMPVMMAGNVFFLGAAPSIHEQAPVVVGDVTSALRFQETQDGLVLTLTMDPAVLSRANRTLVTTEILGRAAVAALPYEAPDGAPLRFDSDYFGTPRNVDAPLPGPFEVREGGQHTLTLWPKKRP